MKAFVAESGVEEVCLEYFDDLGWQVLHGPIIAPGETAAERTSYRDVLLEGRLRRAVEQLNPRLGPDEVAEVIASVRRPESGDVLAENWRVHRLVTQGVPVERRGSDGRTRHDVARLVDVDEPDRNDFVVVNQVTVEERGRTRRPDALAYVNGLPLALVELKVPGQPGATLKGAWNQLRTYAEQIPSLLAFPALSVISTGTQARLGALGGRFEHYAPGGPSTGVTSPERGCPSSRSSCGASSPSTSSSTWYATSSSSPTSAPDWSRGSPSTTSSTPSTGRSRRRSRPSSAATGEPASSGTRRVPARAWRCSSTSERSSGSGRWRTPRSSC